MLDRGAIIVYNVGTTKGTENPKHQKGYSMITLKDILNLMDYTVCDFSVDAFIQVLDFWTCGHYRQTAEGFTLGGDVIPDDENAIFGLSVKSIEYEDDHCMIYLA